MLPRTTTLPVLLLALPLLVAGCCTQRRGGLEGRTLDTPRQAFAYFQEAARLGRYDLEYDTFDPEFIARNGGFTRDDYLRGRPYVHGEAKQLLRALLAAKVERVVPEREDLARLDLVSGDYRGSVWLVRRTYYRLGLAGLPRPLDGIRPDLRGIVRVEGRHVVLDLPLSEDEVDGLGGEMPRGEELTRVEAADRWYLFDVGKPLRIERTKEPDRKRGAP